MSDNDIDRLHLLSSAAEGLRREIAKVIVGQNSVVEELLISVFAGGHALLVGVPGLAKTLLVSSLSNCLDLSFGRVQFTPDLLPADITGTDVLHEVDHDGRRLHQTEFMRGPIFANVVLADEINRTPPKTQAALLQAMQEGHVTVGGRTHALPRPFQVLATRNPIEQEGTYPLPEAQLDRFLLEINIEYPSEEEELLIARRTSSGPITELTPVVTRDQVEAFRELIPRIPVTDEAVELAVRLCRSSRPLEKSAPDRVREYVRYGAGPRGGRALLLCAKARAALRGEAAADVDDVRQVAQAGLRHRLVMSYRAEADGIAADDIISSLLEASGGRVSSH